MYHYKYFMITTDGIINWDDIIQSLDSKTGSIRHVDQTIDTEKTELRTYQEIIDKGLLPFEFSRTPFAEMVKNYFDQGLDFTKITFQNFYPNLEQYNSENHFSKSIVDKFESLVGHSVQECWISRVDAYSTIPFHKDEFDQEKTWIELEKKNLVRYMVFIDDPVQDQIFIVGDNKYENVSKHTVVKWPTTKELHSLINNSNRPNYIFHFLGYTLTEPSSR